VTLWGDIVMKHA